MVKREWVDPLSRGVRLSASLFTDAPSGEGIFGAFSPDDRLVAVIEKSGCVLKYLATFPVTPTPPGHPDPGRDRAMTTLAWADLIAHRPPLDLPVRLTIGVFDGVHVGHRRLFSAITGGGPDTLSLVMTFSRSPVVVRSPDSFPGSILTYRQKVERIGSLGVAGGRGN